MHDPPAVGAVIDRGVIRTREMRVAVEIRGEFTRGATVAAQGLPPFEEPDGRLSPVGVEPAVPNVGAAVGGGAGRVVELVSTRLAREAVEVSYAPKRTHDRGQNMQQRRKLAGSRTASCVRLRFRDNGRLLGAWEYQTSASSRSRSFRSSKVIGEVQGAAML
jgi:hypothetical protein